MTIFKLEMNDAGAIIWFEGNMHICNDSTFELHAMQQHSLVKKLLFSAIKSLNLSWSLSQIVLLMINQIWSALSFFKLMTQLFCSFNLWQKTFPISSWVEELFFAGFTEWCKREKIQIWSHLSWPDNQQRGVLGILNCYFIPWII